MKKVVMAFFVLISLSGCSTLLESILDLDYIRSYSGKPLSREEVAIVTHKDPYSQEIFFKGVDGQKIKTTSTGFIELLPGQHIIDVKWANMYGEKIYASKSANSINSQFKAGHTYIIVPNFDKQTREAWNPSVMDISSEIDSSKYKDVKKAIDDYFQRERKAYFEGNNK